MELLKFTSYENISKYSYCYTHINVICDLDRIYTKINNEINDVIKKLKLYNESNVWRKKNNVETD